MHKRPYAYAQGCTSARSLSPSAPFLCSCFVLRVSLSPSPCVLQFLCSRLGPSLSRAKEERRHEPAAAAWRRCVLTCRSRSVASAANAG
eukprot:2719801-Pleurochrysis_carterae.AAC.1